MSSTLIHVMKQVAWRAFNEHWLLLRPYYVIIIKTCRFGQTKTPLLSFSVSAVGACGAFLGQCLKVCWFAAPGPDRLTSNLLAGEWISQSYRCCNGRNAGPAFVLVPRFSSCRARKQWAAHCTYETHTLLCVSTCTVSPFNQCYFSPWLR